MTLMEGFTQCSDYYWGVLRANCDVELGVYVVFGLRQRTEASSDCC